MADISAIKLNNETYNLKDASAARTIDLSIDTTTYVLTATLKDASGTVISTSTRIDLPLETMVIGGEYVSDDPTYGSAIKLELKNGTYVTFPIGDLISGLQSEITSTNKLDADLVDDSSSVNKFVTASDKTAWNAKSDFSGSYNDLTDKPTIPAAQVNADWNATSGAAQILNKPTIPEGVVVDQIYDSTSTNAQSGVAVAEALTDKVDKETGKGLSSNDFTSGEKSKLAGIETGAEANVQSDWNQNDSTADDYIKNKPVIPAAQVNADWDAVSGVSQILNKPTIPTVNDGVLTIQKNGTSVGTFSANTATGATINITVPVDADDVSALPDTTKYGASLSLSINSTTYVVTASLKDQDGNTLGTAQTIDLPLETVVVGGSYDDTTKKVILTLKNGTTVDFSVADLVAGLQTEITSTNKLSADLIDDTNSTHKFVTTTEKNTWNAKSDFSGSYNDLSNKPTNATTSSSGFMSAADKAKLDAIDEQYHYIQPIFNYDTTTEKTYLALHAYTESGTEVIDYYPTTVQVPLANTDNSENSGLINGSMYLSGTGNVVTGISLSNGTFTITKGMNAMSVPSAGSGISVSQGGTGSTTLTSNAILAGNGTSAVKKISTASGALYATSSGGAASFGTLPVAQGGTGATSASGARSNLGLGSAATYSATSSVTSGSSSLVTSGGVYDALYPKVMSTSSSFASTSYGTLTVRLRKYGSLVVGVVMISLNAQLSANTNYTILTTTSAYTPATNDIIYTTIGGNALFKGGVLAQYDGKFVLRSEESIASGKVLYMHVDYATS